MFNLAYPPPLPLLGDFNGHLFVPGPPSRCDLALRDLDDSLYESGFARFPVAERPFTFRSGTNLSTIDYVYLRGAATKSFQVAK
jgi:hypothetical protein